MKMNRKAMSLEQITTALITVFLLFVVISLFYAPASGLFTRIFGINLTKYVKFGTEPIKPVETTLPNDLQTVYNNLVSSFKQPNSACLIKIPSINANFEGYKFRIDKAPDGMWISVEKDEKGRFIEIKTEKILGVQPCVIAGKIKKRAVSITEVNVAEEFLSFKDCFNNPEIPLADCISGRSTYNHNDDAFPVYLKSNTELGNNLITYDLEDESLSFVGEQIDILYKPTPDRVCFFPTFNGDILHTCNANEKGLDDDCLKQLLPNGELNPIKDGKPAIPFCSGEDVLCNIYKSCKDISDLGTCRAIGTKCDLKCQINAPTGQYCETYNPLGIPT